MHTDTAPLAGAPSTSRLDTCENHAAAPALTLRALIDAYMAEYAGRDPSRVYRLESWQTRLGEHLVAELTDDDVFHALEEFAAAPARIYMGKDADGRPIHRAKGKRSPGTVNRYRDALSAVFAWAIRKRRVPKSFDNPCSKVEKQKERPGVVRYLDPAERARLLAACKAASWPRLYGLVLMALTTGARRGELEALRWRDVDLDRREARILEAKNGEAKVLPLTAAVAAELVRFRADDALRFKLALPSQLVFHSNERPDVAFNFEGPWRAALQAAQVKRFRFHDLRHSCASYLAQDGASLLEIADVMGHRQLAMVKRYAHLTVKSKAALVDRVLGGIE